MKAKYFRATYWNGEYLIVKKTDNHYKVISHSNGLWNGYTNSMLHPTFVNNWERSCKSWEEISKIEAFMEKI